jgi:hypothetical protein
MTSYEERENRLIMEMENRTEYNDGLTTTELCKRILDYDIQVLNDKEKMHILSSRDGTDEQINDIAGKWFEDKMKVGQINRMLRRTRDKYRPGTKYNDTNLKKHQYYLLPPRLQQEDKQWRCVHIIRGINGHLLEPYLMRQEKSLATSHIIARNVNRNLERSEAERKEMQRQRILSRHVKGKGKKNLLKLLSELKKEKKLPRGYNLTLPDLEECVLKYLDEWERMEKKYGKDNGSSIVASDKEKILKEIMIARYQKKEYVPKYEWELLDNLKRKKNNMNH